MQILLAIFALVATVASAQYYYGGYAPAVASYGYTGYAAYPSYGYAAAYPGAYYLKK